MELEAGQISPLDEIYMNAFNLLIGGQGQGKTYHAEELISRNRHHFPVVKRFSPTGTNSFTESDGDVKSLLEFCSQRVAECEKRKRDSKVANLLLRAIREGKPEILKEHNISSHRLQELMDEYNGIDEVVSVQPALVLIDDMGGDKTLRDSVLFNQIARQLRHMHLTIIFNAHRFKDLPPLVRNNTQTVFLHGGLSQNDLKQLWEERGAPGFVRKDDFFNRYHEKTSEQWGHLPLDFYGKKKKHAQPFI